LTLEHIHKYTNLDPGHTSRTIRALLAKKLIKREGHEGRYVYGINFEGLPKEQTAFAERANGGLPKEQATNDTNTNDTNTRKRVTHARRKLSSEQLGRLQEGIYPL
jgi:hypothetical protein